MAPPALQHELWAQPTAALLARWQRRLAPHASVLFILVSFHRTLISFWS